MRTSWKIKFLCEILELCLLVGFSGSAENGSPPPVISLSPANTPCFFSIWLLSSVLVSFS
jgi:hypothetical protein